MRLSRIAVANAETFAIAEYALQWRDIVSHEGKLYGLSGTGVYEITGAIENTASPAIKTGKMVLAQGTAHTVHPANLTIVSDQALRLSATGDTGEDELTTHYTAPRIVSAKRRARLIPMGRGVKANAWSFELGPEPEEDVPTWSVSSMTVLVPAAKPPLN